MCDPSCVNLIDLSLEDTIAVNNEQSKNKCNSPQDESVLSFITSNCRERESLDNNSFDQVGKLSDNLSDPFDIIEKEACLMAQQSANATVEVKLGNLLSLSDDNILDDKKIVETPSLVIEEICTVDDKEIDHESSPVLFNEKQHVGGVSGHDTDSNPNSSSEISNSAKLKKSIEHRKRLLKFSISNASVSSPSPGMQSLEKMLGTPISSTLNSDADFEENLLAAESPLKLVEDEDLIISDNIPVSIESEKKFEADLEMLKIPILSELPSPTVEQTLIKSPQTSVLVKDIASVTLENTLSNIDAIKAKLKAKKEEVNNNQQQEILTLIHSLKSLLSKGEMVDKNKTQKASELLESLSSTFKSVNKEDSDKPLNLHVSAPQTIKRQGTFNVELQEENDTNCDDQSLMQEMPNCMISSSATYDGESTDEKQHLNLPEIIPVNPQPPSHQLNNHNNNKSHNEYHLQTDVNDIMEQLSKLIVNNSENNTLNNNNPTFIVVMNASQFNQSNIHNSNKNYNKLETSINDDSPDLTKVQPRRRSQSLSIHDKVKIVQLPLQQLTPRPSQKQNSEHINKAPPIKTSTPDQKEMNDFKTPSRIMRRNSFSSGSPHTSQLMKRRTGFGYESKNSLQMRTTKTLDTHHEGQHQANVRPLTMPSNNLATFKPDLKKKSKHVSESIIKSSAPLKATIPVKKVAPMIKTCPPTPEKKLHNVSLQSQSKITKLPTTPQQVKKYSTLGVGIAYPNACSTPAALTSPLKRSTGSVSKPRDSYVSTTSNSKSSVAKSATSASVKRRTIGELKAKSPLKARVSGVGLTASTTATKSSRLSTSAGARISKTPVKTVTASKATVKPSSRLSYRVSVGGSVSNGNKENKRP